MYDFPESEDVREIAREEPEALIETFRMILEATDEDQDPGVIAEDLMKLLASMGVNFWRVLDENPEAAETFLPGLLPVGEDRIASFDAIVEKSRSE